MGSSAYPYEDIAMAIGTVGVELVGLGAVTYLAGWLLLAIIARRRLPFAPFVAATCACLAALCVVIVCVVRLHWYAGEPDDCFLSEGAIFMIVLTCPAGIFMCVGAIIALRFVHASRGRRWCSIFVCLLAVVLTGRLAHLLTLPTEDSADATHLVGCTNGG